MNAQIFDNFLRRVYNKARPHSLKDLTFTLSYLKNDSDTVKIGKTVLKDLKKCIPDRIENVVKISIKVSNEKDIILFTDYCPKKDEINTQQSGSLNGMMTESELLGRIEQRATEIVSQQMAAFEQRKREKDTLEELESLRAEVKELRAANDAYEEENTKLKSTQNIMTNIAGSLKLAGFERIPKKIEAALSGFLDLDEQPAQINNSENSEKSGFDDDEGLAMGMNATDEENLKAMNEIFNQSNPEQRKKIGLIMYCINYEADISDKILSYCKESLNIEGI